VLAYTTTGKEPANCKLVEIDTGKTLAAWNVDSHGAGLVRFSMDGQRVATVGGEFTIRIWDVKGSLPVRK
jgi:WD40 repeat protein